MSDRSLQFENIDGAIAEIEKLRGGCKQTGNWSLPQACWHLNKALTFVMSGAPAAPMETPPDGPQRLAMILGTGKIPGGVQAPERVIPPTTCEDCEVAALITTLEKFKKFDGPFPPHRLFGPLTPEQWQKVNLIHVAHHLSKLVPTTQG
jgi:hypothetical protein